MTISRKEFLTLVAAGTATAALAPRDLLAVSGDISPEQYRAAVGKSFRFLRPDGGTVDLVLTRYTERPTKDGSDQFTLVFEAPEGQRLSEGIYDVDAPPFGRQSLFIIPGAVTDGRPTYRADFNLLNRRQPAPPQK